MIAEHAFETPHCVGREAELALVCGVVQDAALGTGSALVWVGERGIGKSRLLQQCAGLTLSAAIVNARCGAAAVFLPDLCAQIAAALRVPPAARGNRVPAVLAALVMRAKRRPVAVFIDDLHLVNASELTFLQALFARTLHHRIVVVGCTSGRGPARIPVRHLLPLNDGVMEVLVRSCRHACEMAADDVRAIVTTAQGNPRVAIELVQHLRDGNGMPLVSATAREVVAAARRSLSAVDFDVLSACSIVGESFEGDWLPQITGRSPDEVANALQRVSDLGLIASVPGRAGRLMFRQIVVRNALYASLVALKRRILHERVVERLAGDHFADAAAQDPDVDVLLGEHAELVERPELAAEAFARAADRLSDAAAFARAAPLYVRAAAQLPANDSRPVPLMRHAIRCYRNLADWQHIETVAETLLERLDDREHAADVAAVLEDLFFVQINDGRRDAAKETVDRIAAVGLPHSAARVNVANLILAYGLCYSGMIAQAKALVATVTPEGLCEAEVRLRYLVATAEIDALITPLEATLKRIDEAAAIARTLGKRGTAFTYAAGAEIACRFGDLETARAYVRLAEDVGAETVGSVNDVRRHGIRGRTAIAVLAGDMPAARELIASNLGWRASGQHNESFHCGLAVTVGMRVGDLALVEAFFNPQLLYDSVASLDAEACGFLLAAFAEVMLVRGMAKELRSSLERCIESELIDAYTSIQLAATRFASLHCAETAVEQVQSYFKDATAPAAAAHVALARAAFLRRQGKHIAATENAVAAAARFRQIGWRLHEAIAFELAGNIRAASRVYQQCGAASDVARLAAGETRKVKYASFGARLSPRELEVARLVAAKRSNRDIALVLDISVRMVDHHIEAAFSKLGIRNRWQLERSMLEMR